MWESKCGCDGGDAIMAHKSRGWGKRVQGLKEKLYEEQEQEQEKLWPRARVASI